MTNIYQLPSDLPIPQDEGSTNHLKEMKLPHISLNATNGEEINFGDLKGKWVIYCYPMTGQPNVALPDGWDQIPGARGCTPQSCSFRDHYQELQALGAEVVGLSVKSSEYQKALDLPTFLAAGMTLLKRLTLITNNGLIEAVHYPIFPSDSDPVWVIDYLKSHER